MPRPGPGAVPTVRESERYARPTRVRDNNNKNGKKAESRNTAISPAIPCVILTLRSLTTQDKHGCGALSSSMNQLSLIEHATIISSQIHVQLE